MNTLIFISLSVAASALAALRIFWIEAKFDIQTVASFMFFQSLLMLTAYADFGINQGVLYRSVKRSLNNRKNAAALVINGVIKKAKLLCIIFFFVFYPILLLLTKHVLNNLQITILCISYIASLALLNFTQVYFRTYDYLIPLAIFNFLCSSITIMIMISLANVFLDVNLFFLLMSQPLSILIVFIGFICIGFYKKLDLNIKSYPWYVVCSISLSGIYISFIGLLYGFFVIMDKIYLARLTNIDGSSVYVFFTVFSGIAITFSGFAYQAGFKYFFKTNHKSQFFQKNINLLVRFFFLTITPLYVIFILIILYYINNFQSEYLNHVRFIPLVILISFNSVFVGFANQYLLANYQHKIIFLYNFSILGAAIIVTEVLFQLGMIFTTMYFYFSASIVGLIYMILLIMKAGASRGNVLYNIMLFGAGNAIVSIS